MDETPAKLFLYSSGVTSINSANIGRTSIFQAGSLPTHKTMLPTIHFKENCQSPMVEIFDFFALPQNRPAANP